MEIWDASIPGTSMKVCETNPEFTKQVNQRGGFTAIGAQTQILNATKIFGPYGKGWGVKSGTEIYTEMFGSLLRYEAQMFYVLGDKEYSFPIASSIQVVQNSRLDDDAVKKVETDAITKGLSKLGFNADVFMGMFDNNKYVNSIKKKALTPTNMSKNQEDVIQSLLKNKFLVPDERKKIQDWLKKGGTMEGATALITKMNKTLAERASKEKKEKKQATSIKKSVETVVQNAQS